MIATLRRSERVSMALLSRVPDRGPAPGGRVRGGCGAGHMERRAGPPWRPPRQGASHTRPPAPSTGAVSAGPLAGQLANALGTAPVDGGLHHREDRTLQRGCGQDLAPAVVLGGGVGGVVLAGHDLPDLLEHDAGEDTA